MFDSFSSQLLSSRRIWPENFDRMSEVAESPLRAGAASPRVRDESTQTERSRLGQSCALS